MLTNEEFQRLIELDMLQRDLTFEEGREAIDLFDRTSSEQERAYYRILKSPEA